MGDRCALLDDSNPKIAVETTCHRSSIARLLASLKLKAANPNSQTYLCIAVASGVVCGVIALVYSSFFEAVLQLVWEVIPNKLVSRHLERWSVIKYAWVYTIIAATVMGTAAGLVQKILGCPGDLPDTVECIHAKGFLPINQAPSMFLCSSFSIAAGGSLGPEAPLLALCAASVSWLGQHVLGYSRGSAALRNCTLIGMSAGLAAFFGVSLGGSLFALEVLHSSGLQFFEMATFAVTAGVVCLLIFRALTGLSYGPIWAWEESITSVSARHILLGATGGMVGVFMFFAFIAIHKSLGRMLRAVGLNEHKTPVLSGMVGGLVVSFIGVVLPPVMFWGEFEMNTLADPTIPLPHIWPKGGIWGMDPWQQGHFSTMLLFAVAGAKLVAISVTVLSGFRGGFIFPIFLAGTALGRGLSQIPGIPFVSSTPPVLLAMTIAAGVNVSITRTPFSTPLILMTLSGHPEVMVPALSSSLTALFLTRKQSFIKSQRDRRDCDIKEVNYDVDVSQEDRQQRADDHPLEVDI